MELFRAAVFHLSQYYRWVFTAAPQWWLLVPAALLVLAGIVIAIWDFLEQDFGFIPLRGPNVLLCGALVGLLSIMWFVVMAVLPVVLALGTLALGVYSVWLIKNHQLPAFVDDALVTHRARRARIRTQTLLAQQAETARLLALEQEADRVQLAIRENRWE